MRSAQEPKVVVVIVNYCSLNDLVRCLDSLSCQRYQNFSVIVVDNASPDCSGKELACLEVGFRLDVVLSPDNRGFAAGANVGMRLAQLQDAEYIWLLNPDTEVHRDSLFELVADAQRHLLAGAFGSKLLYGHRDSNGEQIIWGAGGDVKFESLEAFMCGSGEVDTGQWNEAHERGYLPGCSLLLRSNVLEICGFLPEDYFMYFEETDWCMRIKRHKLSLRYVPSSIVWHHAEDTKMQTPFVVYCYNRNMRAFWYRYGSLQQKMSLVFKTIFKDLPQSLRAFIAARGREQRKLFRAHLASQCDFLLGRMGAPPGFLLR